MWCIPILLRWTLLSLLIAGLLLWLLLLSEPLLLWCLLLKWSWLILDNQCMLWWWWTLWPLLLLLMALSIWPRAIPHPMVHRTTSEARSRDGTTFSTSMVLTTVDTHHWILHILPCPLPLMLMVLLMLIVLLWSWTLALHFEDLIVKVLELVSSLDCLIESSRWYYSGGISFNKGVKSLKELSNLLFHCIH